MTADPRTVVRAFAAGINHFFVTADMHWPLYSATRAGLQALLSSGVDRDDVVVSVVSYVTQPAFSVAPYLEVLAAVPALGRIDFLVAGGVYAADASSRLARLRAQADGGFAGARGVGAMFHDRSAALEAALGRGIDWIGVRYNAEHPGADQDVYARLEPRGSAPLVLGFKSQAGYVRRAAATKVRAGARAWPDRGDAYRFALTPPAVGGLVLGLRRPHHVDALRAAIARGPMSKAERARCIAVARAAPRG